MTCPYRIFFLVLIFISAYQGRLRLTYAKDTEKKADDEMFLELQDEAFARFVELARTAEDRDSKVEYLRRALSARPNHPQNITAEFRIAVLLSQTSDPKHHQKIRPQEALPIYEKIVNSYNHMDYYDDEPTPTDDSPLMMVPRAAILAASLHNWFRDSASAQRYAFQAMQMLEQTYHRRVVDWANTRPPQMLRHADEMEIMKQKGRIAHWKSRLEAAAKGEVFNDRELGFAKAAVRQYGLSHGPQKPHEVAIAMNKIISAFPNTPMAQIAKKHIDIATELTLKEELDELPEDLMNASPQVTEMPVASTQSYHGSSAARPTHDTLPPHQVAGLSQHDEVAPSIRWIWPAIVISVFCGFLIFMGIRRATRNTAL